MSDPPETLGPETLGPETLAGSRPSAETTTAQPGGFAQPGQRIGRFVVERRLGAGAMGVVVLAHDPDLGRPVAIKLLRSGGEEGRERLRREAQAVARIQHPNVIAVHEVGTHDEQVYVVMEYVDGGTLRDWVSAERRPWQAVIEAYRQAGLGLVAAHEAGLVHRDFKPDNVLIGRDGRVRVTDFGIVGVSSEVTLEGARPDPSTPVGEETARLTRTGALIGTPAYMPPEQYEGGADARSDQFAFCVSLYEALFGERPHQGDTVGALLYSVQTGKVRAVPSTDVPAPMVAAIMQGLRSDKAQRHPSMKALLRLLEPPKSRPIWPFAVAGLGVLALAGAGLAVYDWAPEPNTSTAVQTAAPACPDAEAAYASVWGDARREAVEDAFRRRGAFEASLFDGVAQALDARGRAWVEARERVCIEASELSQQRRACLDDALAATLAYVEMLAEGQAEVIDAAVSSVTMLPRIEACADDALLRARPDLEDAQRAGAAPLRKELLLARSLLLSGKYRETVEHAETLVREARELGHDAIVAAGLETLARGQMQVGALEEAERSAREATRVAGRIAESSVEVRAFGTLVFVVASQPHRVKEALGMLETGREAMSRAEDPRARSYFAAAETVVRMSNGDLQGAKTAADQAIEILEGVRPRPAEELANAYTSRSGVLAALDDAEGARSDQVRALEVAEEGLGKQHILYGSIVLLLGASQYNAGQYEDALESYRDALQAYEATLGRGDFNCALALSRIGDAQLMLERRGEATASYEDAMARLDGSGVDDVNTRLSLLQNLAQLAFLRGDFEQAQARYRAAAAVVRKNLGSNHPNAAMLDQHVASVRYARGDDEGAYEGFRGAKTAFVEVYGPKHHLVARAAAFVGDALRRLERCDEAVAEYGEVFKIYSDLSLSPDVTLAQALAGRGICEIEDGKLEEAESDLGRAVEVIERLELGGEPLAAIQFALAQGQLSRGDREAADRSSASAEAIYDGLGPGWATPLAEVRRWRQANGL